MNQTNNNRPNNDKSAFNSNNNFDKSFRVNEQIDARKVRLIDQEGKMIGVIDTHEAIKLAQSSNLDLVEVSPNVEPPVCKIANFGKMRYEIQKKASDAKKKQKVVETKEVKMSFNIGKADCDLKIKQTEKFVAKGNKVRLSIRMKGREISHIEIAKAMMSEIIEKASIFAKVESNPKLEGMQIVVIFVKK